ncbi:cardiolipin synthase [Spongiibacter taiwanensis]|uniref:cardiolipin synthase n=1 Tax=Spongiibacter taiwanensis TaxID=1748242 RepID=UPI002034B69A|nr:cardiolipin synthase [Spongiibacter taiwanensis]USA44115.1 cardiolipin synthase [Spongiibacter taiwanensis]
MLAESGLTALFGGLENNIGALMALVYGLISLLGIVSALEAILKTRTAQGAVAWAIVLVVLPVVFVPLYWIFGRRKFRGYAMAKRSANAEIARLSHQLSNAFDEMPPQTRDDSRLASLAQLAALPTSGGNSAELLIDGDRAFANMFAHIRNAKEYVLLEYYIIREDRIGSELANLLLEKAAEGVAIYCIYDEIGSFQLSRGFIQRLRDGGIHITPFNSTKGLGNRLQLNFRNHRKILVVDGKYACVGGMNVGDEYRHHHPRLSPWRDTSLGITGPAVQAVQLAFAEDWYWACETLPPLNWTLAKSSKANYDGLILATGPADSMDSCALMFIDLIHNAKDRLWIVSPYFVPDAPVIMALQLAALRGVDVKIMLPRNPDKLIIQLSSYSAIRETMAMGVQFYYYQKGFLHQKVLLVDNDLAMVGTANLDNRSFRLNFEICALFRDREFAAEMEAMLTEDLGACRQLLPREVSSWGFLRRLLSRCAYLFAPLQ